MSGPDSSIIRTAGMDSLTPASERTLAAPSSAQQSNATLVQPAARQARQRGRSNARPPFPPLMQHRTTDHIDTSVLDPHEHHHPHDEINEDVEDDDSSGPPSRDAGSESTLNESSTSPLAQPANAGSNAEKGQSSSLPAKEGKAVQRRPRSSSQPGTRWIDPETRDWKDNIVTFDTSDDPQNPKNWTFKRKVTITMLLGLTTMCSTFASSVFSPALPYVAQQYGISQEVAVLGISLFVAGYIPGPVIFAPLSETYGRKLATLGPVFISACFAAGTAVAKDIQTIMITRFFAGVFASAPVVNVGGALADMWDTQERATAVVFYSLAVVAGPNLGPIIGGAVSQSIGWRWTEYLVVLMTCSVLVISVIVLPETFAPVILTNKARQLRWKTGRWALHSRHEMAPINFSIFLHRHLLLPLKMIAFEPMILCITTFNSFAFGILYLLFTAVPIVYENGRGWNSLVGALPFLAVLLGSFTAAGINILYSQKVFAKRYAIKGHLEPEMRLPTMMLGGILFPIGFFILGWTSSPDIHWFPSVFGLYLIGTSFLLIFQSGLNFLIDAYVTNAASAVAANTIMRSIFASALPLVGRPLYLNLGVEYACTLLGGIAVGLAVIPFAFFKYGPKLRSMSGLTRHAHN